MTTEKKRKKCSNQKRIFEEKTTKNNRNWVIIKTKIILFGYLPNEFLFSVVYCAKIYSFLFLFLFENFS